MSSRSIICIFVCLLCPLANTASPQQKAVILEQYRRDVHVVVNGGNVAALFASTGSDEEFDRVYPGARGWFEDLVDNVNKGAYTFSVCDGLKDSVSRGGVFLLTLAALHDSKYARQKAELCLLCQFLLVSSELVKVAC
ncbi:MAG: hypothetical protein LBD36_01080, partial [Holosporales bacterium]|nr:hypothetical protein [Holosporales bacterium]